MEKEKYISDLIKEGFTEEEALLMWEDIEHLIGSDAYWDAIGPY